MEREMAKGEGRHGDQEKTQEASISSDTMSEMAVKKGREKEYKVPFYMLFSFADATDVFLMTLGSIGALGHGATIPVMTVLFGKMIQSFGGAQDPEDVLHRVSEVAIQYVYLAVGAGISSFLQVTCWIATGERQVARVRSLYLKAILKQEIAFFDKETTTDGIKGTEKRALRQQLLWSKQLAQSKPLFLFVMRIKVRDLHAQQLLPPAKQQHTRCLGQSIENQKLMLLTQKQRVLPDIKGDIDFKNVYFRYPSREEQIFRGFSLSIKQGTTTALVGESGSGKSTVISLIERFYDPQAGDVLIDGVKINELQLRWLRSKIGLVSQEPILFASSIRDNVAYGKDNATIEEIQLATDSANASRFIDNMPQGLDTMVGAFGTQLSGGQKQRIAIARAILKDPRILLLDEATSALDTESERTVQEALDRVMKKRTTIVVAHRLSTVRNADSIAVLRHGSIVEKGSHIELVQDPNGAYSQLLRLQEMNQTSDSMSHKGSPLANSPILSNQEISSKLFISREFSSEIIGSPHPDSLELGSHVRVDSKGNALVEPTSSSAELPKEVPLSRLASLNKPEIPILLLGTASAIIHGLVFPVFGVLLSRSFYFAVAGSRLIRRIRLMTFQKVVNMEMAWFDEPENSSGAVGARLSTDAAIVRNLLGDALGLAVHNITILVAGLVIAFASNLKLSLIILVILPILCLDGWIQMKSMKGFSCDAKKMYEQASQVANDAVSSIRTVASFSAEEKVVELYQKKCEGPTRKGIRQGVISGIGFGVSSSLIYCAYAASFYAGARLVRSGETTFGKVFQVFFAFTMAATGISESNSAVPNAEKAKSATASVFAVLDRKSKIDPSDVSGMTLENLEGEIKFRHTVALVGESGSGKSTAIALLQRFYDPDSGNILLDGIELHKFNLKWLRQQMSWQTLLFGIEGNATETEIVAAAKAANAHEFICCLQQGYDTIVGERGVQLSGGQKQRVAIARAILKGSKILLLDEGHQRA
ncbi:hypothetical protein HPP92_011441 [Vanilla planifolia]|uniref:Uncharacterized protein n=1 Tax=Vanilla planifolia TaxID=51239 RepID=A0A835RCD5_VANPL|nr:hypothetical protein HPP92_011441 [Vanilla planifolia]